MKKCLKCEIVFQEEERKRCLYCNSLLLSGSQEDLESLREADKLKHTLPEGKSIVERIINERKIGMLDHAQYLLGSYFRTRTLTFMYVFCRNEFKIGEKYKRFLIQPINISSFLILPWVLISLIDSIFFRILYNGFCTKCGWKYKKGYSKHEHKNESCEYSMEYQAICNDIMTGQIISKETEYKEEAIEKVFAGKKSAYYKLCTSRHCMSVIIDIACIWFSMAVFIGGIILACYPLISFITDINIESTDLYMR